MCRAIATLFLVLSVFAEVAVVTAADPADAAAVAEIQKLGGTVRLLSSQNDDREVDFQFNADKLGDAGLAHLAKIKSLVVVSLKGTKITDAGLAHLKGLVSIRRLHLENTAIGDAGVAQLAGLPKPVVQRAWDLLAHHEAGDAGQGKAPRVLPPEPAGEQLGFFAAAPAPSAVEAALRDIDVNVLTPLEALNKLFELRQQAMEAAGD